MSGTHGENIYVIVLLGTLVKDILVPQHGVFKHENAFLTQCLTENLFLFCYFV